MNAIQREILEVMIEMKVYEPRALSHRTGLSEPLIEQLVEELSESGFVEPLASVPEAGCVGCALSGRCDRLRPPSGWALTEKGAAVGVGKATGQPATEEGERDATP